jgi:hypothetical protein
VKQYEFPPTTRDGTLYCASKEAWLDTVMKGRRAVYPPDWWSSAQQLKGRSPKSAAVIWYRQYDPARRFLVWSQASDEDFRSAGYLVGED